METVPRQSIGMHSNHQAKFGTIALLTMAHEGAVVRQLNIRPTFVVYALHNLSLSEPMPHHIPILREVVHHEEECHENERRPRQVHKD